MIAQMIVITPNWETDLNSEKTNGNKQNIITNVVLITALPVVLTTLFIISFSSLFNLLRYALIIWIESSTIRPKTIVKIKALDRLK